MDNRQDNKATHKRKRSPGYPMINLEEAVERAKILWDKDKNNPIPVSAAYDHLGYKTTGGYGGRVLSALKQFGLIYEKQGDILLTNEAVDLALHGQQDKVYIDTVKKLALNPNIYEKLFNEYDNILPSDATLKVKLIKEYEFHPDKVDGFISDFRRTIEYAKLLTDKKEELGKEKESNKNLTDPFALLGIQNKEKADIKMQTMQGVNDKEREIANYPIGKGLKARILVSGPSFVTSDSIKKLIGLLQLNENDLPEIADFDLNDKNETSKQ